MNWSADLASTLEFTYIDQHFGFQSAFEGKAEAIRNRPPYVSENPARRQAQQRPQFVTSLYFKD